MQEQRHPATDDRRTTEGAEERRAELVHGAAKGMRDAVEKSSGSKAKPSLSDRTLKRSPPADAIGTPSEGAVEDGEGASVADLDR